MKSKLDAIIAVSDVEASSSWYQSLFECTSKHGGSATFDVLTGPDDEVLFCLHQWGEHGHPSMQDSAITPGNGLILYFKTSNLEQIRANALKMQVHIIDDIHFNTNSNQPEFSFRDPDGYFWIVTRYHEYEG